MEETLGSAGKDAFRLFFIFFVQPKRVCVCVRLWARAGVEKERERERMRECVCVWVCAHWVAFDVANWAKLGRKKSKIRDAKRRKKNERGEREGAKNSFEIETAAAAVVVPAWERVLESVWLRACVQCVGRDLVGDCLKVRVWGEIRGDAEEWGEEIAEALTPTPETERQTEKNRKGWTSEAFVFEGEAGMKTKESKMRQKKGGFSWRKFGAVTEINGARQCRPNSRKAGLDSCFPR